jgi:hypothetical protein
VSSVNRVECGIASMVDVHDRLHISYEIRTIFYASELLLIMIAYRA